MNNNKRKRRKIFLLFVVIVITTVIFIVETYAWFVGYTTVNVSEFNVNISSSDGLELSLDAEHWKKNGETLTISKDSITKTNITGDHTYVGNTNKWSDSLKPISSIGAIDSNYSRAIFYDESNLVDTVGGYQLTADRVDNYTAGEADGYIAFDLFIRNGSGIYDNDVFSSSISEDVFLSGNSEVTVSSGTNGAANSLRVGFYQLGSIHAKGYTVSDATNISCATNSYCTLGPSNIVNGTHLRWEIGIVNIWEPNASRHVSNLVNYFNAVCKNRDSYGNYLNESCRTLEVGHSVITYPIAYSISSSDNVNIYDGLDINQYGESSSYYNYGTQTKKLYGFPTYKTSDATSVGAQKEKLLRLASGSITKVRIYIWLEGQDIDNYDLISNDGLINIKFGFTKDRYGTDTTNNNYITNRTSTFEDDSWEKIKYNIQHNNTSQYHVGDTRQLIIDGKRYIVRLANKSTPASCNNSNYSQTACGFVVEFIDGTVEMAMRSTATTQGGYPATNVYNYLKNTLYDKLPDDLKKVIINTKVISGYGSYDSSNFTTNDKLYLLSGKEVFNASDYDTSSSTTHQLEYYSGHNVTTGNYGHYTKKRSSLVSNNWWLRSPGSGRDVYNSSVSFQGGFGGSHVSNPGIVEPAFRIG